MSSLATAHGRATSGPTGTTPVSRIRGLGVSVDAALAGLLAVALGAVVFIATGGTDLGPNTWVQIALLIVGAGSLVAAALTHASRTPAHGTATVALFAALAVLTYLSIAWSVQPATSWLEANRTLSYLAAFAAAVTLARLAPRRWPAVVGAVAAMTVVVCAYALLAKVFPATLNASDTFGRLRVPFGYWNATGLLAALGLPACLWAATRPATGRLLRTLTIPGLAVLLTALMLSYSRGALLAAVIGLGCWFILVPVRLRAVPVLALGVAGGAVATLWALAHHAITHDDATLPARTSAGHDFGLVLVAVLSVCVLAGFVATRAMDRIVLPPALRRRIAVGLLICVAMVPVIAIAGVAASSRGLTGEISHEWSTLTSTTPSSTVGDTPGRIAQLSNSRPLYWSEGLHVGEHALLAGVGAGGFDTARTRYTTNPLQVAHAHSYAIETFADLGLIGVAVSLALLIAWALAVRRTLAGVPADSPERIGLITMLAVVLIYGVSSAIDWTWFVPGVTVPALLCAGWLAGRGPLAATATATDPRAADPRATDPRATDPRATDRPATASGRATSARPTPAPGLGRIAAATATVAIALIAAWFVWQPLHSSDEVTAAIGAITRGDTAAALGDARSAANTDPVSTDPLWELSAIYSALGQPAASRAELVKATQAQPENPETWQQLGSFDLQAHRPQLALPELQKALGLDRTSALTVQLVAQARGQSQS